jgi:hypothetical protein
VASADELAVLGLFEVLELQAEGGKVLPARSFLAGHPLAPGTRLGGP